ncbi:MAG: hypothetical protein ACKOOA_06260 [Sediminibacterium sp.]
MQNNNNNDFLPADSAPATDELPPMGSFSAWYVLLIVVLIIEIIFFSWLTKTFA